MNHDIDGLKELFIEECEAVTSLKDLQVLRIKYLSKKGIVTQQLKNLSALPREEKPRIGKILNEVKGYVEEEIKRVEEVLTEREVKEEVASESLDITLPGKFITPGNFHPVTQVLDEIIRIFAFMGFTVEEGPEVELDYYNFEALNIPKDHPARDMQDTFYVKVDGESENESDVVLRTHTSPVQIRVMEKTVPPFRIIAPGKVYRCDADISHTPMFHQVEGLMIGEDVTFAHLKGVLEVFIHKLFSTDTPVRFRPSYFPFTEPSAEVDIGCILCSSKGCRVCKGTGWLEVLGAGMVHPKVFEAVRYDPERYTGFAFGMGVERLTMLKFGIDDIRLFFENDLRFLKQF
jgi:phenylalanyl-tRNA synthetase alpha chain